MGNQQSLRSNANLSKEPNHLKEYVYLLPMRGKANFQRLTGWDGLDVFFRRPEFLDFLEGWYFARTHQSKTNEDSIRVIPDTLRKLWILLFPRQIRSHAGGASVPGGSIVPRPSLDQARIQGIGCNQRVHHQLGRCLVGRRGVLIQHPFPNVSVHVVQPPWISGFLSDFLILETTVSQVP